MPFHRMGAEDLEMDYWPSLKLRDKGSIITEDVYHVHNMVRDRTSVNNCPLSYSG